MMRTGAAPLALTEIAACVFAAYGTLFDMATTIGRARDRLGGQARELARLWRLHQQRLSQAESPESEPKDFWHLTGRALDAAFADLGIKDAPLRARLMQLALNVDAFPDAKAAVEGLRALGLKVAVLSNATLTMLLNALKHTGLERLTDTVVPADASKRKPASEAYGAACEKLRLEAARILYVSADARDAEAAGRLGFKAVWLRRDPTANEAPKSVVATISNLDELDPLLHRA